MMGIRGWAALPCLALLPALLPGVPAAVVDTVDEIHYSYGDPPGSVVINWRGQETALWYGLTDAYGHIASAGSSATTPVDRAGPFREVELTNLSPGTTYHYRIGASGQDRTLRTAPTAGFRWVDVGDTASAPCRPRVATVHQLIASLRPQLVTHGGGISMASECGVQAVHDYYVDQEAWSTFAAFQPVWGEPEGDAPAGDAPPGTPPDSLANYKGRGYVTHPQAASGDSPGKRDPPGCPGPLPGNNCPGEDWGWFRAGRVLFISHPYPWAGSLAGWRRAAGALMTRAQADPGVEFIVTYGHLPAYSSDDAGWHPATRAAIDALADRHSPRPDNPGGKYVLNIGHHVPALEVFRSVKGLTHLTNGTGGGGGRDGTKPDPRFILRTRHPGVLVGDYDPEAHRLSVRWVCGPVSEPAPKDHCTYGTTVYSTAFTAPGSGYHQGPPAPAPAPAPAPEPRPRPRPDPPVPRQWVGNPGVEGDLTGWAGRYGPSPHVRVSRTTGVAHSGTAAIKVLAGPGADGVSSGFNDSPKWVAGARGGTTFTASIWVKPGHVGQVIALQLREWTPTWALVTDRVATVTAGSTGWQRLSVRLTTARPGTRLAFAVYAHDLDPGEFFLADDASLTS